MKSKLGLAGEVSVLLTHNYQAFTTQQVITDAGGIDKHLITDEKDLNKLKLN